MCGIAGVLHLDPRHPVDDGLLAGMASIQRHRGPDGLGWHSMPAHGVGFAHARLAIIDLGDGGHQPLVAEGGDLLLAHNGEFYDYPRLRAELTANGARFRTKSDSELVLHMYRERGLERMLRELRGEFAFAVFDPVADELVLVRDRFGIKPLYWARTDDAFVFGSEVKVVFSHPDVKRAFDPTGLYHQLMQATVPGTTAYAGVHQVPPGHAVVVRRRKGRFDIQTRRYWDMPFPLESDRPRHYDAESFVEQTRSKLIEAVQLRLVADVPVGCYLSGGIDSCSILGLSAATRQDPVRAFTIGFDSDEYDETPIAREMAVSVGAEQDVMMLDASRIYDHFVETHWHTERTIYNTLGIAKLLMSRHVRDSGYKVVLTGEGSDELFAGYPSFRNDLFLHRGNDPTAQAGLQESNAVFRGAMLPDEAFDSPALRALCGFTPTCLQPWLNAGKRVPALLADHHRTALEGYDPGAAIAEAIDPTAIEGRHPLDKAQYVWIKTMLESQILTWGGDRVDMANSMEARPAFLDHHLAEFAATIPPELRIRERTEKWVLREAMKGLLPRVLYEREKFAFMAPPAHTDPRKRAAVQELVQRYLSDEAIEAAGLLDANGVRAMLAQHDHPETPRATKVQLDAVLNHTLGVQILHETMIRQDVPRLAQQRATATTGA